MDSGITIQAPASVGETPTQLSVGVGQSATVGVCHCGQCEVDLRIHAGGTSAFTGRVTVGVNFWLLSNLSNDSSVTVMNMDDWYQYVIVEPGRMDVPVPFEVAQIELTGLPEGPKVAVFGHEPRYAGRQHRPVGCQAAARRRPLLDRRSTYFSVLRESSMDRSNGVMETSLPTSSEIADKLRHSHRNISPRAIDAHIKYISEKLRLPKGTSRDVLVAVVIRSNLLKHS